MGLLREQIVVPKEGEFAIVSGRHTNELVSNPLRLLRIECHITWITERQVTSRQWMEDELRQKARIGVDELHCTARTEAEARYIGIAHRVIIAEA